MIRSQHVTRTSAPRAHAPGASVPWSRGVRRKPRSEAIAHSSDEHTALRVVVGGVRGTRPVGRSQVHRYGGDTLSVLIESPARRVVLDAGTGLYRLVDELLRHPRDRSLDVFLSHLHLDHVIGLPSLLRLQEDGWNVRVWLAGGERARHVLHGVVSPPLWPRGLTCVDWRELPGSDGYALIAMDDIVVRTCPLVHPDGSVAFRIESGAAAVVFVTDFEWARTPDRGRAELISLCTDPAAAELLLCEGQYTPVEARARRGWGHSTWEDVVEIARLTGIECTRVIHHDPARDDDAVTEIERAMQRVHPACGMAMQGEILHVNPRSVNVNVNVRHPSVAREYVQWLIEHYHNLTSLTDVKAGSVIAMHAAIAAGTFQGLSLMQGWSHAEASAGRWVVVVVVLAAAVYAYCAVRSLQAAFAVVRPRVRDHSGAGAVMFYQSVGRFADESDPGSEWLESLERMDAQAFDASLAANAVAMARIVHEKVEDCKKAVSRLGWALAAWSVGAGLLVLYAALR
jgi:phosphoribosyl 1,2-cyclic phosphodiesterase